MAGIAGDFPALDARLAGSIVLAGAATVAEPLRAGMTVSLQVDELGEMHVLTR